MSKYQINIDFTNVDLTSLETDEDFKKQAKLLLPQALVKLGETVGEKTWEELNNTQNKAGTKQKFSQSEKRRFIQETGKNYQRHASNRERQELEDYIVEQLRTRKQGYT